MSVSNYFSVILQQAE